LFELKHSTNSFKSRLSGIFSGSFADFEEDLDSLAGGQLREEDGIGGIRRFEAVEYRITFSIASILSPEGPGNEPLYPPDTSGPHCGFYAQTPQIFRPAARRKGPPGQVFALMTARAGESIISEEVSGSNIRTGGSHSLRSARVVGLLFVER
jgi:hypothetical protein